MTEYFVYILECSDKTYYIGITQDLGKRIRAHNGKTAGGAKYTRGRRPVKLVHSEIKDSKSSALKREFELKNFTRLEKEKLFSH